jgi:catechol 2,3-dioxygenase-like lactoylglutathione lyase family enzyme
VADGGRFFGPGPTVAAVALTVDDAASASEFFQAALDCKAVGEGSDPSGGTTKSVTLWLGGEMIVLEEHLPAGRPVPADSCSYDLWFQHLAIVVSDIRAACDRLNACGVRHTSPAPQRLPAWNPNAGGIRASYFRDPDGHPLELISFPPDKGGPLAVQRTPLSGYRPHCDRSIFHPGGLAFLPGRAGPNGSRRERELGCGAGASQRGGRCSSSHYLPAGPRWPRRAPPAVESDGQAGRGGGRSEIARR